MKYDPNMAGKQELSTFEVQHKYLWNFMLHNPLCSQITFLFLKNTETEEKLGKGSQMEKVSAIAWYKGPSMESDFCGAAVQAQVSLSPPALPMPSVWFSDFSSVQM